MNEILIETNLSKLTPNTISTQKIRIDYPTILMVLPDININICDIIGDMGFLLSNCGGIIVPIKTIGADGFKINTKEYYFDLKKNILKTDVGSKLKILNNIPKTDSEKYYIYDLTPYSKIMKYLSTKYGEKVVLIRILNELSSLYESLKQKYPTYRIENLFIVNNLDGTLYNTITHLSTLITNKDISELNFYDNYTLVSNGNNTIIPLFIKDKLENTLVKPNLNKIRTYIEDKEITKDLKKESIIDPAKVSEEPVEHAPDTLLSKIIQNLQKNNLRAENNEEGNIISVGLDQRQLSNVLKKYKIEDPDIIANVKSAMDTYINLKGEKLSKEEAETTVLKAINYTVHGKEEIDTEYLNNPELLIKKLSQAKAHRVPLDFPKTSVVETPINPNDVVDLKYTTGVWRQKVEFEKTIHTNVRKLFESIESVSNKPIKVQKIDYDIIDDDTNRYINYKITLKNTSGGKKDSYVVELNVPSPVNDRYFKIRGSRYIIAAQQFFKPVTKTDKNEVRVISNYSIVHLYLQNLKFSPSDIDEVVKYIQIRYPTLIKELKESEYVKFNDDSILYLAGSDLYEKENFKIIIDPDTNKLKTTDNQELNVGKNEYSYEILLQKIKEINPEDNLSKTKKSIPFIQLYIGSIRIPLILYLWQLKGLLTTLNDFGVDYEMKQEIQPTDLSIETENGFLVMNPKNLREQLFCNGILAAKFKKVIKNLDSPDELHPIIDNMYGQKATFNLRLLTQNEIDPVTRDMLTFENLPTTLPNLLTNHCVDVLLNKKADSLSDLKLYRARLSEIILNIMYKQLMMAHNRYYQKVEEFHDENAQLALDPNFVINDIITTAGVLQHTEAVNPIDEIFLSSRTIKTGYTRASNI